MFIVQTGCGKTHLVLDLIENQYNNHLDYFDCIVIICPTFWENSTYHAKGWIKNDDKVWLVDPKGNLYQWIKKLSELLRFLEVLFIINDIIANESLDKRRQPLLELSTSGRHRGHYLWLLTQSYTAIPKKFTITGQRHFCLVSKGTRKSQSDTRRKRCTNNRWWISYCQRYFKGIKVWMSVHKKQKSPWILH